MAALAADKILFNSTWCMNSFLDNIGKHLKLIPDYRPQAKVIREKIEKKASVVYFPIVQWPTTNKENDSPVKGDLQCRSCFLPISKPSLITLVQST